MQLNKTKNEVIFVSLKYLEILEIFLKYPNDNNLEANLSIILENLIPEES